MNAAFQLQVIDEEKKKVFVHDYSKRVEIGRQDRGEAGPYSQKFEADRWRLVIAPLTEDTVSRHHLWLEPLDEGRFRIKNGSKAIPIRLTSGEEVRPGEIKDLPIPSHIMIGRKLIRVVQPEGVSGGIFQELPEATLPPGAFEGLATRAGGLGLPFPSNDTAGMVRSLRMAMEVLQAAASSTDFFEKAAQAASDLVGLDSASVWLLHEDEWVQEAYTSSARLNQPAKAPASRHVLNRVRERAKTLWDKPEGSANATTSLDSISAVVAAPILNRQGRVIGALYGDRSIVSSITRQRGEITELQAMLVELLASGIAAGLERLRQEQAAVAARVQFEQFFTHDLALQLEKNPDLLKGRESEVTLLFCDIRGFSRISEKLGPAKTLDWINDVMGALSECVLAHQGVLVDYIGDELMAMWGAPSEQPEHASMACRAALEMIDRLPEMSKKWEEILGEPLELGVGINTGLAQVGNTGTARKFKYGPLGTTVNLASRVQGATKHFKTHLLITEGTRQAIDDSFSIRRLGKVRVINIDEPVELYELFPAEHPDHQALQSGYESALDYYLSNDPDSFRQAAGILGTLQVNYPHDGPSLTLLARVVNAMCDGRAFCDVWTLESK
ncbi:adenylate/guanylate cyclase domain-containing protein [Tundrisphaera lichenicola]|uniref:adenylate/guanylate cyclase domain-containing protein n=1 Tax=Tundrisphaera lichenicola TaxID=2029860 RepID=UPI003EB90E27